MQQACVVPLTRNSTCNHLRTPTRESHCDCLVSALPPYRTLGPYRSGRLQFSPVGSVPHIDGNLSSRPVHRCARQLHPSPFGSPHGCTILLFHGTGADLTESPRPFGILTDHACMQNQGSQFTDSGIWYVLVYRIHVSGRIQGFEGFKHEMGDCAACRFQENAIQHMKLCALGPQRPHAPSAPIVLVRIALVCNRQLAQSQSLGL